MIEKILDQFIDALEKDDMSLLNDVLDENVQVNSSALGVFQGLEAAKERFKWKGEKLSFCHHRIFNLVTRSNENKTYQSFYALPFLV